MGDDESADYNFYKKEAAKYGKTGEVVFKI